MDNPFETATALVGGLQKDYDRLNEAIPKLKEVHKQAKEELSDTNRKVVDAQAKLEGLNTQIRNRTGAYNKWQAAELAKLETAKSEFAKQSLAQKSKTKVTTDKLESDRALLAQGQKQLATDQAQLGRDQKEANEQKLANIKRTTELDDRETDIKLEESENITRAGKLNSFSGMLDQREARSEANEKVADETVRQAEEKRKKADKILADAQESVDNNAARGQELDIRERLLSDKDKKLRTKEIALNDRAGVMNTH